MSFLAAEGNRPDTPFAVFSGDTLFADSVGRPDLLGDDQSQEAGAAALRLAPRLLPEAAGRRPGPPGPRGRLAVRGRHRRPAGDHHRLRAAHNKALQITDEEEFVEFALQHRPARAARTTSG